MSTIYYFANWKMYQSLTSIKKFIQAYKKDLEFQKKHEDVYIGLAVSYEHLYYMHQKRGSSLLHYGAQDCSHLSFGAYTGQVSVHSLDDMHVSFSIVGHSEAREYLQQSTSMIALKFKALLAANISPVLCIGDTLTQKQNGTTLEVLYDQLELILEFLQSYQGSTKIFIAYEPVYAIGTGLIPDQEELQNLFYFFKKIFKEVPVAKNIMFLYGGSVSSESVSLLQKIEGISGFLIGKASINFQE